jgi:hypothetical protein
VWVNYVWQQHFGRGLVATPGDFGLRGARPTHPELLDWLARELVKSGWSTKHLHRLLVLSNTYRQAARPDSPGAEAANAKADPDNRFWWRWSPRRLEAEAIRDAMVFVSGTLDLTAGGPSAPFGASAATDGGELDPTYEGYVTASKEAPARPRRSVYMRQLRDNFPVMQKLFDGATANESCTRRHVATVASQPLYLLNNPFILRQAEAFARRVRAKAGGDEARQVEAAFLLALGRPPDEADRQAVREFLDAHGGAAPPGDGGTPPKADPSQYLGRFLGFGRLPPKADPNQPPLRLVHLCHAILNLNEFLYLP